MMFAAGFGTRMRPLTDTLPKPLIRVAGKPLIDHSLDLARAIGPAKIVCNLHHLSPLLEKHLADTDVITVREEPTILDTGGGLRNALPVLGDDPVVTTNTDAIWLGPNPFPLLMDAWDPDRMDGLLVCVPRTKTHGHPGTGDFDLDDAGRITRGRDGCAFAISPEGAEGGACPKGDRK
jgi:MurNAc alpha-1-phosphate uridylyltransferase